MPLEEHFNFLAPYDIRIKGSRIGIETVLYDYLYENKTAEDIAQVYAQADEFTDKINFLSVNFYL